MSKTYVVFLANGQSYDVHNVDSLGYTGAEGHQKNLMLSDPDGNILAMLSENHCGVLYKRPTEPGEAPRFPLAAPAGQAQPQSAQTPARQPSHEDLERERIESNKLAAKGYMRGHTQGESERNSGVGYQFDRPCPYGGDHEYWERQGWGDGYHDRGFHIPGR